jgi:uncharacterized membrane protein YbaN (DUF454 family)
MTTEQVITLITLIVGLIGAIATLVPTLIKLFNAFKEIAKNKNWQALKDIAKVAMKEVEEHYRKHPEMTSEQKLNMAIEIIVAGAAEIDVEVNEDIIREIVKYINETIKWANDMKKDS